MKKIQISPSILSADFSQLGNEIKRLETSGADMIHVDVMDGHFVPNLTIGPPVIKALKKQSSIFFDVHLMISPVHEYIEVYAEAGADIITIHPEATNNLKSSILKIKKLSIFTPYTDEINQSVINYFKKENIEIDELSYFDIASDLDIGKVDPQHLYDTLTKVDLSKSDALFVSCTALPILSVISELEKKNK